MVSCVVSSSYTSRGKKRRNCSASTEHEEYVSESRNLAGGIDFFVSEKWKNVSKNVSALVGRDE